MSKDYIELYKLEISFGVEEHDGEHYTDNMLDDMIDVLIEANIDSGLIQQAFENALTGSNIVVKVTEV